MARDEGDSGSGWPTGAGEMARLIRAHDWAASPLGPASGWPESLRGAVEAVLALPIVASLAVGPERRLIFNDATAGLFGGGHSGALGRPLGETFAHEFHHVSGFYDRVFAGESVHVPAQPLDPAQSGAEEVFDAYLIPVRDAGGAVIAAQMMGFAIGERLRAEAGLRDSEERLAAAFATVPIGLAVIDTQGKVVLSNPEFDRFPPGRFIPSGDAASVGRWRAWDGHGAPLQADQFPSARALRGEQIVPGQEMLYTDAEGREIWTIVATAPLRERGEAVSGAVAVISDIDAAKRSIDALRESEEKFSALFAASPAPFLILKPDAPHFTITEVNDAYLAATMRTRNQLIGRGLFEAFPDNPDDADIAGVSTLRASLERVLATHRPDTLPDLKYDIAQPDGGFEERWWSPVNSAVLDGNGEVAAIIHNANDVTAQYRVEAALRESEARLQDLIEGMPQLVWRAVDDGQWTWASPQWTAQTGQAEADSLGFGWLDAVHLDDRERVREIWTGAIARGEFHADYRIYHNEERRYRWFQTRATPVRDAAGQIVEWLGTSTDVDDLREMQSRQQLLVAELQHRVRNVLTVVRAVFARTTEAGGDAAEIADHFKGRLDALARTQVLSTRNPSRTVDLEDLIRDELLSVGASDGPRISLSGPDVTLEHKQAEAIGLAIHELTTNALKYGALKSPTGKLSIRWKLNLRYGEPPVLDLTWLEQGIAAVPVSPARRGFGRELIEDALPYQLGARTTLEFRGNGARCSMSVPLGSADGQAVRTGGLR